MTKVRRSALPAPDQIHSEGLNYDLLEHDATPITLLFSAKATTPVRKLIVALLIDALTDADNVKSPRQYEARMWWRTWSDGRAFGTWAFFAQELDLPADQITRQLEHRWALAVPSNRRMKPLRLASQRCRVTLKWQSDVVPVKLSWADIVRTDYLPQPKSRRRQVSQRRAA
jgi:hypothetical protein